jgi:hypothetical protein
VESAGEDALYSVLVSACNQLAGTRVAARHRALRRTRQKGAPEQERTERADVARGRKRRRLRDEPFRMSVYERYTLGRRPWVEEDELWAGAPQRKQNAPSSDGSLTRGLRLAGGWESACKPLTRLRVASP